MLIATYARTFILILAACMALLCHAIRGTNYSESLRHSRRSAHRTQRKFVPLGSILSQHWYARGVHPVMTMLHCGGLVSRSSTWSGMVAVTFVQARIRTNGKAIPLCQRRKTKNFSRYSSPTQQRHQQPG